MLGTLTFMCFFRISQKYMVATLLGMGICLCGSTWCSRAAASEVAVIRIRYSWASEVLPIVRSMLSPKGTVSVSERINSLIIVDNPDAIKRVRAYLDQFDQPLEQVRIHVRFSENKALSSMEASAHGKASSDNLRVEVGRRKKDEIDHSIRERQLNQIILAEFLVFAASGRPAFIRAGQQIPYKSRWTDYSGRYSAGGAAVIFQSAETGFEVTPTTAGDLVHLKIVPRIAYGKRNDAIIRFYGAQTAITTFYGQWVEIGGTATHSNEVIKEILSQGVRSKLNSMVMSVKVEKP